MPWEPFLKDSLPNTLPTDIVRLATLWITLRRESCADDTQMAIGVAETLVACRHIDEQELCKCFATNYTRQRGYGRGARIVIEAMIDGSDHKYLAANHFPGGSFGNGAAMRVAPVGLMFRHDLEQLWEQASLSALPTHVHRLGIEGAQLLALAVGLASTSRQFDREQYISALVEKSRSIEYSGPLRRTAQLNNPRDLALFGNGIEATSSVVTAIACFALAATSYEQTIGSAVLLGGDTDTIAAMAGAISGAYLGRQSIPTHLIQSLEDRHQGRQYIEDLAKKLCAAHRELSCGNIEEGSRQ
jgi:poly(ADP-ribose) glycohydrolase ARH3